MLTNFLHNNRQHRIDFVFGEFLEHTCPQNVIARFVHTIFSQKRSRSNHVGIRKKRTLFDDDRGVVDALVESLQMIQHKRSIVIRTDDVVADIAGSLRKHVNRRGQPLQLYFQRILILIFGFQAKYVTLNARKTAQIRYTRSDIWLTVKHKIAISFNRTLFWHQFHFDWVQTNARKKTSDSVQLPIRNACAVCTQINQRQALNTANLINSFC